MIRLVFLAFLVVSVCGQQRLQSLSLQSSFSGAGNLSQHRLGLLPNLKFHPRLDEVSTFSETNNSPQYGLGLLPKLEFHPPREGQQQSFGQSTFAETSNSSQHELGMLPKLGFHVPLEVQRYIGVQQKSLVSQQSLKYQHPQRVSPQSRRAFQPQLQSTFSETSYPPQHVLGLLPKLGIHPHREGQQQSLGRSTFSGTSYPSQYVLGLLPKLEYHPHREGQQQQSLELQQPLNVQQKSLGVMHSLKNQHELRVPLQPVHQHSRPTFQNQHLQQVRNHQNSQQLPYQRQQVQQQNRVQNRPMLQQQQTQHQTVGRSNVEILEDNRDGPFQDGTYYFRFATGDGIQKEEGARITSPQTHQVTGSYSYVAPDGTLVAMEYIADENGYRAFPARPDRVNPLLPPERIPFPPPLHAVLNTPRPAQVGSVQI